MRTARLAPHYGPQFGRIPVQRNAGTRRSSMVHLPARITVTIRQGFQLPTSGLTLDFCQRPAVEAPNSTVIPA